MGVINIAIAGFGGVGRATARLLLERRKRYREVYNADVRLIAVCGSRSGLLARRGLELAELETLREGLTGTDFVDASGADILIEAGPSDFRTGGPGLPYIQSSLQAGRDTIVISKGALVHSGKELRRLAQRSAAALKLSGAAAAALPTIDLIEHSLKGCEVLKIEGILNATTNFLLHAMTTRGIGFETALQEAQKSGFTEADTRNDTEGWDTACKLLLISNFALGADLTMNDVSVDGLHSISDERINSWRKEGFVPKLVGTLIRVDGNMQASVGVKLLSPRDPLANVTGKNKAIRIITDAMGETIAFGSGIEPLATAAAALKDLEHILQGRQNALPRPFIN